MWHKLGDEAERLLESHAAHHVDNVVAITLRDPLHQVNLHPKIFSLLVAGSVWSGRRE